MTMINDVLKQLEYLNSLHIENKIEERELTGIHKILDEEVKAKEKISLDNVKVVAFHS